MRKRIAAIAVLVAVVGGIYFGSAYWAARHLRQAALSGDTDRLEAAIDFPAVRTSLKAQIAAAMMRQMQTDPAARNNPFAGLGMMLAPTLVDRMVDGFVTPEGISAMVQGRKLGASDQTPRQPNPDIRFDDEWVTMDRFRVRMTNTRTNEQGPALLFARQGFAGWKLVKLELPDSVLR